MLECALVADSESKECPTGHVRSAQWARGSCEGLEDSAQGRAGFFPRFVGSLDTPALEWPGLQMGLSSAVGPAACAVPEPAKHCFLQSRHRRSEELGTHIFFPSVFPAPCEWQGR